MNKQRVYKVKSVGFTDVGKKRQRNEDFYAIIESKELYILADGMGGHTSGQIASRKAVESVIKFMLTISQQKDFKYDPYIPDYFSEEEKLVYTAIKYANSEVYNYAKENPQYKGMGTTLIVLYGTPDSFVIGYVGDSRVYRMHKERIEQISEDHSLLVHLMKTGQLTEEGAKNFKGKNIILKAVGLKPDVEPDVFTVAKHVNDCFLLCSDGLSDLVEDFEIEEQLRNNGLSLYKKAQNLINLANARGGKDNITVVLVSVQEPLEELIEEEREDSASQSGDEFEEQDTDKIRTDIFSVEETRKYDSERFKRTTEKIKLPPQVLAEEKLLRKKRGNNERKH